MSHSKQYSEMRKKKVDLWLGQEIKPLVEHGEYGKLGVGNYSKNPLWGMACRVYGHGSSDWKSVLEHVGLPKGYYRAKVVPFSMILSHGTPLREEVEGWLDSQIKPLIAHGKWLELSPRYQLSQGQENRKLYLAAIRNSSQGNKTWRENLESRGLKKGEYNNVISAAKSAGHQELRALRKKIGATSNREVILTQRWLEEKVWPMVEANSLSGDVAENFKEDPQYTNACRLYGSGPTDWDGAIVKYFGVRSLELQKAGDGISVDQKSVSEIKETASAKYDFAGERKRIAHKLRHIRHEKRSQIVQVNNWLNREIAPLIKQGKWSELKYTHLRKEGPMINWANNLYGKHKCDWKGTLMNYFGASEENYSSIRRVNDDQVAKWLSETIAPHVRAKRWSELSISKLQDNRLFCIANSKYGKHKFDWKGTLTAVFGTTDRDYQEIIHCAMNGKSKEEVDAWLDAKVKPLIKKEDLTSLATKNFQENPMFHAACTLYGAHRFDWKSVLEYSGLKPELYSKVVSASHAEGTASAMKKKAMTRKARADSWLESRIKPLAGKRDLEGIALALSESSERTLENVKNVYGNLETALGAYGVWGENYKTVKAIQRSKYSDATRIFSTKQIDGWLSTEITPLVRSGEWAKLSRAQWKNNPHFNRACADRGKNAMDWSGVLKYCGASEQNCLEIKRLSLKTVQRAKRVIFSKEQTQTWMEQKILPRVINQSWKELSAKQWMKDPHFAAACKLQGNHPFDWKSVLTALGVGNEDYARICHETRSMASLDAAKRRR